MITPPATPKRYFAMLDDEDLIEIQAESFLRALDQEPENTHWMFSETSLRDFIAKATERLERMTA